MFRHCLTRAAVAVLLLVVVVACTSTAAAQLAAEEEATTATTTTMHHLHFYLNEAYAGPSPTVVQVVNGTGPPVMSRGVRARFGDVAVIDDVLREGPSTGSRTVGRAQGLYATASRKQGSPAMLLTMNLVLEGYSGSTLAVVGRNEIMEPVHELPVVGGTGRFRMATGYVIFKTVSWKGVDAVLEVDAFVLA